MAKVLVTFDADWADEFSVYGFRVMDKADWEQSVAEFKAAKKNDFNSFWFGTNEGWEAEEIADRSNHWLNNYTVKDITDEEAAVFTKLFKSWTGECEFGTIRLPGELVGENDY